LLTSNGPASSTDAQEQMILHRARSPQYCLAMKLSHYSG
jgi:hypothetical protein